MKAPGLDAADRRALQRLLKDQVRFDEPMARHTRFRIGGPADALAEPESAAQLKALLAWTADRGGPYTVIGGGTNLLVRDGGIRGVTIRLGRLAQRAAWRFEARRAVLEADAGLTTRSLCALALRNGWQGLNFALGIPGCLGGAVHMNAGTALGSIGDIVESVSVMTGRGEIIEVLRSELSCGYRRLGLPDRVDPDPARPAVILRAGLRLAMGDRDRLRIQARELMQARSRRQPAGQPSAGCFFRNPSPEHPAGRLIDAAGFKGKRVGDAQVSPLHANFIVNRGRARAADVMCLAAGIEAAVREQFGIQLQAEVRIVGDDRDA